MFSNSIPASETGVIFYECQECGQDHSVMLSELNSCIECGNERFNVIVDVGDS